MKKGFIGYKGFGFDEGGGTPSTDTSFSDSDFSVFNDTDLTKVIKLDNSEVPTSTLRSINSEKWYDSILGKFWNVVKTFYIQHIYTTLTQNINVTWQNKDITVAGLDDITISRTRPTIAVVTNNIDLDWDTKNDLVAENQLSVTANATVSYSSDIYSEFADFILNISNLATITFPSGTISPDDNFSTLVWTPPENGIYSFGLRRVGSTYILLVTQKGAV